MLFDDESGGAVIGGDIDRLREMDIDDLRETYKEIYHEDAKKKSNKKKTTKVASLRSSKDKKFIGHTGRG